MSTSPDQKHEPAATPNDKRIVDPAPGTIDTEPAAEAASEVSMRLNLLGKLIIPPSSP
ncbi:MAG TPA: hypothetical protein VEC35_19705 [Noviherbaspirillum sp.]|nr:hypothetical protein [Noviherbaspirillum sp.]